MKNKTRKQKRIHYGGALNCDAEGFNKNIREASLGANYYNALVSHNNSEKWPYEKLVDISTRGLVNWYCKRAKLDTDQCSNVKNMDDVKILGAFFHRYKVYSEHIGKVQDFLKNYKKEKFGTLNKILQRLEQSDKNSDKNSDKKLYSDIKMVESYTRPSEKYEDFLSMDLPIESAIDKVQCLLWVIVKKGELPDGFVMDKRIKERALEPIKVTMFDYSTFLNNIRAFSPVPAFTAAAKLIKAVKKDNIELSEPPLTFGVFK